MKRLLSALTFAVALFPTVRLAAQPESLGTFKPLNPPEMQQLTNFDSPAWQASKHFLRGANLGDYLEVSPGWDSGVKISASDFVVMKQQGFDHVRVPIGWQHYSGPAPDFTLSPPIFSRVDFVVTNALAASLAVMINIHHFDELDKDPGGATDEFLKIWEQIAAHYKNFPPQLAFELDNEPHMNATTASMNPIYARVISEIRQSNPGRTIFVEPGDWGSIRELKNLVVPPDDNLIVSVHCYDPFHFTHQGASWTHLPRVTGIQFPGPPATPLVPDPSLNLPAEMKDWIQRYNTLPADQNPSSPIAFITSLKYCREWSDYYGRPIHLGEFGAYTTADPASRAHFYGAFRRELDKERIGWAIWDWNSGFHYWDKKNNQPAPGMHEALFGN
jgi:endoglucanase